MDVMFKIIKLLIKILKPLAKLGLFDGIFEDLLAQLEGATEPEGTTEEVAE